MERVKNSRRLHIIFDAILGAVSFALAMVFSSVLDWPVNALIGILIVASTALVISQHRKASVMDEESETEV